MTDVGICKTTTPCDVLCPINIDGECEVHRVMVLLVCNIYRGREIFSEIKYELCGKSAFQKKKKVLLHSACVRQGTAFFTMHFDVKPSIWQIFCSFTTYTCTNRIRRILNSVCPNTIKERVTGRKFFLRNLILDIFFVNM